jgi:hypothetical protein
VVAVGLLLPHGNQGWQAVLERASALRYRAAGLAVRVIAKVLDRQEISIIRSGTPQNATTRLVRMVGSVQLPT